MCLSRGSCVCCTVRGDLIKALTQLMKRKKKFDHVLIETTGLADPAPVAFVRSPLTYTLLATALPLNALNCTQVSTPW